MGGEVSYTCTPHYKEDAGHSWLDQDSSVYVWSTVSLWMPSQNTLTLEDIVLLMESFASSHIDWWLVFYSGQTIVRDQMSRLSAKDYVREDEPF